MWNLCRSPSEKCYIEESEVSMRAPVSEGFVPRAATSCCPREKEKKRECHFLFMFKELLLATFFVLVKLSEITHRFKSIFRRKQREKHLIFCTDIIFRTAQMFFSFIFYVDWHRLFVRVNRVHNFFLWYKNLNTNKKKSENRSLKLRIMHFYFYD